MNKKEHHYLNILKLLVVGVMLVVQFYILYFFLVFFTELGKYSYVLIEAIAIIIALQILGSNKKYIYKLSLTVFLVVFPVTAIVFYLLFGNQRFIKKIKRREDEIGEQLSGCKIQNSELINNIDNGRLSTDLNSIYKLADYPAYQTKECKYYRVGEDYFEDMITQLEAAEKYIIIEFYIIARGQLYDRIKKVLIDKVNAGVEVYIIYDKMGSMRRFSQKDENELANHGINITAFNKKMTRLYRFISYRTHRKIVVIDGKYCYTGGCNLADEYINVGSRFGHWKDMGIRIEGAGANSFIFAFFKTWILLTNDEIDINKYLAQESEYHEDEQKIVIPFTDEPTNDLEIASHNYMRIISNSTKYVYITTPYLIIDEEMITCLKLAAKSGVDVRIILPGVADHKFVYELSMAHCLDLILAGVKIYTYKPGFIHGKTIVSDDYYCTVGSVNFDYRSLLWNYECAIYAYDNQLALDMKADIEDELKVCRCINESYLQNRKFTTKVLNGIYRLIGPLF